MFWGANYGNLFVQYVEAVEKKPPNPDTASWDTIDIAQAYPLIIAKLQIFLAISQAFNHLTKYQTNEPLLTLLSQRSERAAKGNDYSME